MCYLCFLLNVSLPFCSTHSTDNKEVAAALPPSYVPTRSKTFTTRCFSRPFFSMAIITETRKINSRTYQSSTVALFNTSCVLHCPIGNCDTFYATAIVAIFVRRRTQFRLMQLSFYPLAKTILSALLVSTLLFCGKKNSNHHKTRQFSAARIYFPKSSTFHSMISCYYYFYCYTFCEKAQRVMRWS